MIFRKKFFAVLFFLAFTSSHLSLAAGGGAGNDGSGGNSDPDYVTKLDIMDYTADSFETIADVFRYLSFSQSSNIYNSVLFKGPRTVFDSLYSVTINYKPDEPCIDNEGNEKDGAADIKRQTICLSLARIQKRLNKGNLKRELMALLVHEISHLAGANEMQAMALQDEVRPWITLASMDNSLSEDGSDFYLYQHVMKAAEQKDGATYAREIQLTLESARQVESHLEEGNHARMMDVKELAYYRQKLQELTVFSQIPLAAAEPAKMKDILGYFYYVGKQFSESFRYERNYLPWMGQYQVLEKWQDVIGEYEPVSMNCTGFQKDYVPVPSHNIIIQRADSGTWLEGGLNFVNGFDDDPLFSNGFGAKEINGRLRFETQAETRYYNRIEIERKNGRDLLLHWIYRNYSGLGSHDVVFVEDTECVYQLKRVNEPTKDLTSKF